MGIEVVRVSDHKKWDNIVTSFKQHDIYFLNGYVRTLQKHGDGEPLLIYFEDGQTRAMNVTMKKDIGEDANFAGKIEKASYFDLSTPYGYGGPMIEGNNAQTFCDQFAQWCRANSIVSEFVRFHPILNNAELLGCCYDVIYLRNTVGTSLMKHEDFLYAEFSSTGRRYIKKALNEGVSFRVTPNPDNMDDFKKYYYATMDRNSASDYYYFNDRYFQECHKLLGKNIALVEVIYEEKTIAVAMGFLYNKVIHMHLSGALNQFLHLFPAYILFYAIALWGRENGYELIHYGGGRSNAPDDSLYLFKKKFGKETEFKFYIGKKIWDEERYNTLLDMRRKDTGFDEKEGFFPAYRSN